MSTQEPMTEAGKALHRALCGFSEPHGCITKDGIARLESAARAIGAQQERERLRAKTLDTENEMALWCEDPAAEAATGMTCYRCRSIREFLLSDPQPDEPAPEQL